MYLSKLLLNLHNAGARRDVVKPYGLHQTLKRGVNDDGDNRLLFRIEPERKRNSRIVLVQSAWIEPDWSPLLENDYLSDARGPTLLEPQLQSGQQLAFRLLGNPTKKREGKRIALDDETAYHDWLKRKADQSGFQVLQVTASSYWINEEHLNRSPDEGYHKRNIPHFGVRFDGLLRVTDPEALVEAVRRGIGPAKAFGFGLLSLARAASR